MVKNYYNFSIAIARHYIDLTQSITYIGKSNKAENTHLKSQETHHCHGYCFCNLGTSNILLMESHAEVEIGARPQLLDYSLHDIQHGGAGPEQVHVRDTQWQRPQPTMRGSWGVDGDTWTEVLYIDRHGHSVLTQPINSVPGFDNFGYSSPQKKNFGYSSSQG